MKTSSNPQDMKYKYPANIKEIELLKWLLTAAQQTVERNGPSGVCIKSRLQIYGLLKNDNSNCQTFISPGA